jgi:ferredoxin
MAFLKLHLVRFGSMGISVVASSGTTLLEAAHRAGIGMPSVCAGQRDCGECQVIVLEGRVSDLTSDEREKLSESQVKQGYRLACSTFVKGPVKVLVP